MFLPKSRPNTDFKIEPFTKQNPLCLSPHLCKRIGHEKIIYNRIGQITNVILHTVLLQ